MVAFNEFRVIGPPGTGKTSYLCSQVELATRAYCDRLGVLPAECRSVLMCSLTKAAANEIRQRDIDLPAEQIGTLHAHAYRALGRPPLCVDAKLLDEWNGRCNEKGLYGWRLSSDMKDDMPDRSKTAKDGNENGNRLLQKYHFNRSRLTPREAWPMSVIEFATEYEQWKQENGCLDFSDVIHDAYTATDSAPGCPSVIMVDEAQDNDRAELRLIRKWAKQCEKVVIVGDPDQNIFEWRGSEPEAFYEVEIPPENNRILAQSYRVPRAVHAQAMKAIGRIKNRRNVEYRPRDAEGSVCHSAWPITGRCADEGLKTAERYMADGKRIMFLASCEYLLTPLMCELKDRGIPFWNQFAKDRGRFNPLHPARGVSAVRRLTNYLLPQEQYHGNKARFWTWDELHTWTDVCKAEGLLKPGMKTEIGRRAKSEEGVMGFADVAECFDQAVIDAMDADALGVFQQFIRKDRASALNFAIKILRKRGIEELGKQPQVTVGTIHSVKGGEADVVFLSPDLSPQGYEQYDGKAKERDAIHRLFYVGMTRAKETLVLCETGSPMSVNW